MAFRSDVVEHSIYLSAGSNYVRFKWHFDLVCYCSRDGKYTVVLHAKHKQLKKKKIQHAISKEEVAKSSSWAVKTSLAFTSMAAITWLLWKQRCKSFDGKSYLIAATAQKHMWEWLQITQITERYLGSWFCTKDYKVHFLYTTVNGLQWVITEYHSVDENADVRLILREKKNYLAKY